jgi:hypothetical protein
MGHEGGYVVCTTAAIHPQEPPSTNDLEAYWQDPPSFFLLSGGVLASFCQLLGLLRLQLECVRRAAARLQQCKAGGRAEGCWRDRRPLACLDRTGAGVILSACPALQGR